MGIALIDALAITETEKEFSIEFVSLNESQNTGGEIILLPKAKRCGAKYNLSSQDMIAVRQDHGHPYPIHTHLILKINDQQVFL